MTLAVAMATAAVCFANGDVQPTAEPTDNILGTEVSAPLSSSCTVKVYWRKNGQTYPYKYCKVVGENWAGFWYGLTTATSKPSMLTARSTKASTWMAALTPSTLTTKTY